MSKTEEAERRKGGERRKSLRGGVSGKSGVVRRGSAEGEKQNKAKRRQNEENGKAAAKRKNGKGGKTAKFSQLLSEVGEAEQGGTTAGKGAH